MEFNLKLLFTKFRTVPRKLAFSLLLCAILVTVLCLLAITWLTPVKSSPVIQTTNGKIQGSIAISRDGLEYWQFLGIPYAKPPIGTRKYLPPEPAEPWKEIKSTTEWPPACAQYDGLLEQRVMGKLDCLYLNVFVSKGPSSGNRALKPVLVWIHGGAFYTGSVEMYHPDYLMDEEDIILVSMNYRQGPLGFLNLQDPKQEPHGNVGILDQHLALQWVQQNIAKFGGNPKLVTLYGESAGSLMAHLHVLSPMSTGLFQKAIMQSGYALSDWGINRNPRKLAAKFSKKVGCSGDKLEDLRKCYENTEWEKLVTFQECLMEPLKDKDLFEPTIDGKFLTDDPKELLLSGRFPDIPVMFGVTGGEGGLRTVRFNAYPELIERLDTEWENLLHNALVADDPLDMATAAKAEYFGTKRFVEDIPGFYRNFTKLTTDLGFFWPMHNSAIAHAKRGAPTYLYYFNYTSKNIPSLYSALLATRKDDWLPLPVMVRIAGRMVFDWFGEFWLGNGGSRPYGVMHGDDLYQVWNFMGIYKYISGSDRQFSRDFIRAIVDFVRDEKPLKFQNVTWPTVNEHLVEGRDDSTIPYMLMDKNGNGKVVPEPFSETIKFWATQSNYTLIRSKR